jgi:hypothetical protein
MFGSTQISEGDRGVLDGVGDAYSFLGLPWRGNYNHSLAEIPEEGTCFFRALPPLSIAQTHSNKPADSMSDFSVTVKTWTLASDCVSLAMNAFRWLTQRFITGARQAPGREAISRFTTAIAIASGRS